MKLLCIHIAKLTFCLFGVLFISVIQYIQGCIWAGGGGWEEKGVYTAKVPLGSFYLLPLERHPVSLWPLVISHVCWELFCSSPYKPLQVQLFLSSPVSSQAQETFSTSAAGYPVDLLKIFHHLWATLWFMQTNPCLHHTEDEILQTHLLEQTHLGMRPQTCPAISSLNPSGSFISSS